MISEEEEKASKEALCPPSLPVTGEEDDIFSRADYLTLQGRVEKIQVLRMAEVQGSPVPVLDLSIRCGQKLLDVSLWRDEALCELYLGDETTERKEETLEMQVVGVSRKMAASLSSVRTSLNSVSRLTSTRVVPMTSYTSCRST
ncbi:unnamed protein product [Leuciscus chuanchicus]